jgi:predicted ArsR family transcriptional regulator
MENREAITAFMNVTGGIHKSQLMRELGFSWGVLSHHLNTLSRDGLIVLQYWGRELWVFDPQIPEIDRLKFVAANRPVRLRILDYLSQRDSLTVQELSEELSYCKKTVRTHLSHLLHSGNVERHPGRPHRYAAAPSEAAPYQSLHE